MKKTCIAKIKRSLLFLLFFFIASCTSNQPGVHERIKKAVDDIWLINTHEHLISEDGRLTLTTDLFYLLNSYVKHDLISSGMKEEDFKFILDSSNPLEERWNKFHPYWEKTKNTGYALCLTIAVRDLFGLEGINEDTYKELNEKLLASNKEGWYKYVLKDKALIDVSILDPLDKIIKIDDNNSKEFFVKVKRFNKFVVLNKNRVNEIEKQANTKINTLTDLLNVLDAEFQKAINEEGIVGIKSGLAYGRTLYYEDVPQKEAENLFNKMIQRGQMLTIDESKKLQDFMMHQVIGCASRYRLPIQIHTGLRTGNSIRKPTQTTNATHLANLFLKYKEANFVIFHGSYPYMAELTVLAKKFPNVYIDMCWMHIISPAASKQYLEEWLMTVPSNKIMAFGGDFGKVVEGTYGHSVIARKNVTEVLTKMVEDGYYSEKDAILIAKRIFRENALELYQLKKVGDYFERLKDKTLNKDRIRPYPENPLYWQYKGKPILLLGGSKDDNLFQIPDLKEHLDSLKIIGGNYIRNVMSSRKISDFEIQPFKRLANDQYDLNQWNNEYWDRFQKMLQLTAERDIIVQIEIWAFHDFNLNDYLYSPWKPANNINYDTLNCTLSDQSVNIGRDKHEFFFTVPKLNNDTLLLKYQNLFADKILTYTLEYDHILYCITNEIHPQYSPEWGWYWANYIREISKEKGKTINVSEMFWETDLTADQHKASLDYPEIYNYFEISQNSANSGEKNWTYTQYIRKYLAQNPRPINSVKIYGSDTGPFWAGKSKDGIEKFWRNILGGCASSRFHRPHGGIGFSELAQNSIKAVRKLETGIKLWEVSPDNELLTERDENEAYLAAKPGKKYIIYFTEGGEVGLNLIDYRERFSLRWIDINTGDWLTRQTYLEGGEIVNISTPFQSPSIAVILDD